jgi:serine/threonine protein kinase
MFMVMPYRRQGSLADWLQKRDTARPLSLKDTERIVKQAANALQHAHNHRIIHQDIKPSNFLIQGEAEHPGQLNLQLADFGVAKLMTTTSESQTIRGTPTYMAPEQWDGHPVPATDQYALAVMTYELLTGYPPFIANNNHQMWHLHYHVSPQPPSAINPTIPQELDAVLLRALSKNSDERYRSVAAFARAFQQAMPNSDRPLANNSIEGAASPVTRPKVAPTIPVRNANDDAIPFSQRRRGLAGKGIFVILLALVLIGASILGFLVLRSYPPKNINSIESHTNFKGTHIVSPSIGSPGTTGTTTAMTATAQANGTATANDATATGIALGATATATAVAATATATSAQATATAISATATAYAKTVTPGSPVFNDPLQSNSGNNWDVTNLRGGGGCAFTGGAYHASMPQKGYIAPCFAQATSFSNFTYQVQMIIVKGDQGGIAFRANSKNGAFYYFHINQNGSYALETYSGYNSTAVLKQGTSPAIKTGLNQTNVIAVVANGNSLVLYVNKQQIASVNDGTYSNGQIGVIAESTQNPTEVAFTNAEVRPTQ